MSAEDLQQYYEQLQNIGDELNNDPTNEELIQLRQELKEVIALTEGVCSMSNCI
jgi:uncharacterized protein YaaR (DUF327 family)